jgi:hypothetical protein
MAYYYFDLVDVETIADAGGFECKTVDEAKEIARGLAIRLVSRQEQLIGKGVTVVVRSEVDEEVYRVALDAVNKLLAN